MGTLITTVKKIDPIAHTHENILNAPCLRIYNRLLLYGKIARTIGLATIFPRAQTPPQGGKNA